MHTPIQETPHRNERSSRTRAVYLFNARSVLIVIVLSGFAIPTMGANQQVACIGEASYFKRTIKAVRKSLDPALTWKLSIRASTLKVSASDGTVLHGYRLKGSTTSEFILVIPGNGISAREIVKRLSELDEMPQDIYVFDYRGHGEGEGEQQPAIAEFANDFRVIWNWILADRNADVKAVYAFSQGGIVAAGILSDIANSDGILVIDGTPSKIPSFSLLGWDFFSCPEAYDPISQLRRAQSLPRFAIVRGSEDRQVTWRDSRELIEEGIRLGGLYREFDGLYHPLSPRDDLVTRMHILQGLLHELSN